ncbi:hypothetical protein DFP93_10374 [Aneurinibacillus soli]|uniref:Uncharacterized protein n=1 Tax=Aneurinibacillus soli TaxID=1500254 RepID=A0A0U5C985_9BACL|nr:competence protein CoiA [Aneurinibacillus soli]PYE62867.1 hypothetical protein DFP93_10374 [Aneurinibacillus soli]BAU29075.1 hypothetical protein CB4_03253 [Aneurinibacillus soli]
MQFTAYEGGTLYIEEYIAESGYDRKTALEKLKKLGEKGALTCPFCKEFLRLKARESEKRKTHFFHLSGKACMLSQAHDTYNQQTTRESEKHSIIKDVIYNELKTQERIKEGLNVEYGVEAKAEEKWKHYPDILVRYKGEESAISILTNVSANKDAGLVKLIQKRNQYFKDKGLETIWFVEEMEMTLDMKRHVLHLWEAEVDLCTETTEDKKWKELLSGLQSDHSLFDIFGYHKKSVNISLEVRSLYYVYSTDERIEFSVHRFILDEKTHPFRAFALNKGYRMSLSTALLVKEEIVLSDAVEEERLRREFVQAFHRRKEEFEEGMQAVAASQAEELEQVEVICDVPKKMDYSMLKDKLWERLGMTQPQQMRLWNQYVLRGFGNLDKIWELAQTVETFEELELLLRRKK